MTLALIQVFALNARSSALRWLIVLVCSMVAVWLLARLLNVADGVFVVLILVIAALITGKVFVESVRRMHDCGQGAAIASMGMLGIGMLFTTAALWWLGHGADGVAWSVIVLAVIATGALFLRSGDSETNAYGAPARGLSSQARPSVGRTSGAFVAIGFGLVGLCAGLAILSWHAALERQRNERTAPVLQVPAAKQAEDRAASSSVDVALENENAATSDRIDALLNDGSAQ